MKSTTRQTPPSARNKVIVYDDACPMCSLYTRAFVHTGMLEKENRISFSQLDQSDYADVLDPVRARHEIPLLDLNGGATLYGVDALVYILRQRLPFIAWGMKIPGVAAIVRGLYAVVSYNRRVIIPSCGCTTGVDCTPDFHLAYRGIFIGFALFLFSCAVFLLFLFGFELPVIECLAVLVWMNAAIAVHGIIAWATMKNGAVEYAGQSAVTLLLFAIPTMITAVLGIATDEPLLVIAGALPGSVFLLWQHDRRVSYLGKSSWWTVGWICTLATGITVAFVGNYY
jgi:predicted DCC family thiol-disulfide oxidoreductase YuxK